MRAASAAGLCVGALALGAGSCAWAAESEKAERAAEKARLNVLITHHAKQHAVPEALVRRVIKRESNGNPKAYRAGNWGLMQIRHNTARGLGYAGEAQGLLDPEVNLTYGVRYLAGAYKLASGDHDRAIRFYQRGYYYEAKRRGMTEMLSAAATPNADAKAGSEKSAPDKALSDKPSSGAKTEIVANAGAASAAPKPAADGKAAKPGADDPWAEARTVAADAAAVRGEKPSDKSKAAAGAKGSYALAAHEPRPERKPKRARDDAKASIGEKASAALDSVLKEAAKNGSKAAAAKPADAAAAPKRARKPAEAMMAAPMPLSDAAERGSRSQTAAGEAGFMRR